MPCPTSPRMLDAVYGCMWKGELVCCLQVTPLITELGRTRMEVNTKVKAGFTNKLFALNVVITIPVPDTTARAEVQTSIGGSPSHSRSRKRSLKSID